MISSMTTLNAHTAAPLLTDADVHERVRALVGPATTDRQLWIMFVDGDNRQSPVLMPISQIPREPEPRTLRNLGKVLAGVCPDLATDAGPGSVILTLERQGLDGVLPTDRVWGDALSKTCAQAEVTLRGIYLSTERGVRRLSDRR